MGIKSKKWLISPFLPPKLHGFCTDKGTPLGNTYHFRKCIYLLIFGSFRFQQTLVQSTSSEPPRLRIVPLRLRDKSLASPLFITVVAAKLTEEFIFNFAFSIISSEPSHSSIKFACSLNLFCDSRILIYFYTATKNKNEKNVYHQTRTTVKFATTQRRIRHTTPPIDIHPNTNWYSCLRLLSF